MCARLQRMRIQAHRGAADWPENMLTAFRQAVVLGADDVEMDLQVTAEPAQLVVAHDPYVKSECRDKRGNEFPQQLFYRDLSLDQIQEFDCGSVVTKGHAVPGEKVSSLHEVLTALAPLRTRRGQPLGFNIEIKYNSDQPQYYPPRKIYVGLLLDVLDSLRRQISPSRLIIQSFDVEILKELRQKRQDLRLSPLLPDVKNALMLVQDLRTDLITPHISQVSQQMLAELHSAQPRVDVIPWTVNSREDAEALIRWGADGAITDRPEMFVQLEQELCLSDK